MRTVRIITARLPLSERMTVETSWDQLRDRLQRQERNRPNYPKMDISEYPKQSKVELPPLMDSLMEPLGEMIISGNLADEAVEEGGIEEISEGTEVVGKVTDNSMLRNFPHNTIKNKIKILVKLVQLKMYSFV